MWSWGFSTLVIIILDDERVYDNTNRNTRSAPVYSWSKVIILSSLNKYEVNIINELL